MKKEKFYIIPEDTYNQHIDQEVHLYGMLHQLAFVAGKVKDAEDVEHFRETAIRYGKIADEMFAGWNIPGRYLVYGDKADLHALKETEIAEVIFEPEDDGENPYCLREIMENFLSLLDEMGAVLAEALGELDALDEE